VSEQWREASRSFRFVRSARSSHPPRCSSCDFSLSTAVAIINVGQSATEVRSIRPAHRQKTMWATTRYDPGHNSAAT